MRAVFSPVERSGQKVWLKPDGKLAFAAVAASGNAPAGATTMALRTLRRNARRSSEVWSSGMVVLFGKLIRSSIPNDNRGRFCGPSCLTSRYDENRQGTNVEPDGTR